MNSCLKPARLRLKPEHKLSSTRTSARSMEMFSDVAADKTGAAGDQNFHSNPLHEFVHLLFLLLDRLNQLELCAAAVKIVVFAMHLEIRVPRQKIRQKTNANFKRDQLAGKRQQSFFPPASKIHPPTRR